MKPIYKIILGAILLLLIVLSFFYVILKTDSKDLSDKPPFTSLINIPLKLEREVFMIKNKPTEVFQEPYLIIEKEEVTSYEITKKTLLKKGTKLTLAKAKVFKNGVSGLSTCMVFGEITMDSVSVAFEHHWGRESIPVYPDDSKYFTFAKPIWEVKNHDDQKRYEFK